MWKKLLRWVLKRIKWILIPALKWAEPLLAEWIEAEKVTIIQTLNEADGKTLAKQICDKIREEL